MGIGVEHYDTHTVLVCRGRLDIAAVRELRQAVTNCLSGGPRLLILDMAGTEITDTAAIGALIACHGQAKSAGSDFRLARVPYPVRSLIARAKVGAELQIYETVEDAVAPGGRG